MAATKKSRKIAGNDFPPDVQAVYDTLTLEQKNTVNSLSDPNQKLSVIAAYSRQNAADQDKEPTFTGGGTSTASTQGTYFERALGVEGGQRRETATNKIIPGSYTGFRSGTVTPYGTMQRAPKYFESDVDLINTLGREQIALVQAQMKKAGALGSKYRVGIVDEATKKAFEEVLVQANRSGADWRSALGQLQANPVGGSGGLAPKVSNQDDLKRIIQQSAQYVLGRDLDEKAANDLVRTYQQMQVKAQTQGITTPQGMRTDLPDVQTFAQKRITKQQGGEADAYKFAKFADAIFGGD
jgi:hypothetical protein